MKKIFTLMLAISTFTIASAQSRERGNDRYDDRNSQQYGRGKDSREGHFDKDRRRDDDRNGYNNGRDNNRYEDQRRRAEWERINRDYDRQIIIYRNDRRMNARERDRRIHQVERERAQRARSFGAGVGVGAIAGLLLGVIISKN